MKTIKIIIAALAFFALGSVSAQPLEFKGTPLGATFEQFTKQHPEFKCIGGSEHGECTFLADNDILRGIFLTFAGQPASFMRAKFRSVGFASIYILMPPGSYGGIKAAIAEKYGEPKTATETVSNRFGFSAEDETSFWILPGGRITAERYSGTLDNGMVEMTSTAELKRIADEIKAKKVAGKSDL